MGGEAGRHDRTAAMPGTCWAGGRRGSRETVIYIYGYIHIYKRRRIKEKDGGAASVEDRPGVLGMRVMAERKLCSVGDRD